MISLVKRVKNLENQMFEFKKLLENQSSYSQEVQSSLWNSEDKQKKKNKDLSKNTTNVMNSLINYEVKNDQAVFTNATDITDAQESISELAEMSDTNSSDITDCQEAISELMEIIEGGAE